MNLKIAVVITVVTVVFSHVRDVKVDDNLFFRSQYSGVAIECLID